MGYNKARWDAARKAFQAECRTDPRLKTLRFMKFLLLAGAICLLVELTGVLFLTTFLSNLLLIVMLNFKIKHRKRTIKSQYLSL